VCSLDVSFSLSFSLSLSLSLSLFLSLPRSRPISQSLTLASPSVFGLRAAYDNNNNNNTRTRPGACASTVNQRLGRGIARAVRDSSSRQHARLSSPLPRDQSNRSSRWHKGYRRDVPGIIALAGGAIKSSRLSRLQRLERKLGNSRDREVAVPAGIVVFGNSRYNQKTMDEDLQTISRRE